MGSLEQAGREGERRKTGESQEGKETGQGRKREGTRERENNFSLSRQLAKF